MITAKVKLKKGLVATITSTDRMVVTMEMSVHTVEGAGGIVTIKDQNENVLQEVTAPDDYYVIVLEEIDGNLPHNTIIVEGNP